MICMFKAENLPSLFLLRSSLLGDLPNPIKEHSMMDQVQKQTPSLCSMCMMAKDS